MRSTVLQSTDPAAFSRCAEAVRTGELVLIPTDTVYGIAAMASNESAVKAIYTAKGKGESAPLQLLCSPRSHLRRFAAPSAIAERLLAALGPGGWTIIVPAAADWDSPALAGGSTVGLRIPAAPFIHDLVDSVGAPLAATSANRHGEPSPRSLDEALAAVGNACAVAIDAGPLPGVDSTVIDCSADPPRILREGAIDRGTVARILNLQDIEVVRSVRP